MTRIRKMQKGQALVEFALTSMIVLMILFGIIDVMRIIAINTTLAEASRQGARQAIANTDSTDNPYSAFTGNCSGLTQVSSASGTGCQTDAAVENTVSAVMKPLIANITYSSNTPSASCTVPTPGNGKICISPSESSGATPAYASCAAARSALGHQPAPGELGPRQPEWANNTFQGCYLVQVTVIYAYDSINPIFGPWAPSYLTLESATTMIGEY